MMDFIVHNRMSKFLKSVALSPPHRPGNGFDLLNIVVINPTANNPRKMLIPMDMNLTKHFAKKKIHRHFKLSEVAPLDQKCKSEESFEQAYRQTQVCTWSGRTKASTFGKHSSTTHVNTLSFQTRRHSKSLKVTQSLRHSVFSARENGQGKLCSHCKESKHHRDSKK
jgi:hypothetical protein